MSSIKLSPKYGVNPSMSKCFWCGEVIGIALMGRINPCHKRGRAAEDLEAPMEVVLSYEPCPACQEHFSQGVVLFEATSTPMHGEFQPSVKTQEGEKYPTGKHIVIRTEAFNNMTNGNAKDGQMCACDGEVIDALLDSMKKE